MKNPDIGTGVYGSGFLAKIEEAFYLVTVAHLGDPQLLPRKDWSVWGNKIQIVEPTGPNNPEGSWAGIADHQLFRTSAFGHRIPRFKYFIREDQPDGVADVILIPIEASDPLMRHYRCFNLPEESTSPSLGEVVTLLGRRDDFPSLATREHHIVQVDGPIHVLSPTSSEGDSGGPVIDEMGQFVGMNFGVPPGDNYKSLILTPNAILAVAQSTNGVSQTWPKFRERR
ncbi:serine protease family protein [Glutamicibacter arilaitensis]|uniref:hypothetical protein n=1 Tax=Glutamicibacter arilaitensis TaxID=256701 RepID=UPI001866A458|nr:hypothetical protein [Glutamicibacter arilaitensis]